MSDSRPVNSTAVLDRPSAAPSVSTPLTVSAEPLGQEAPRAAGIGADFDVTVIGAGPGGYVAAIRAAQLGMRVAVVEKNRLGGTCLNTGCIPTKAMLASVEALNTARKGREFGFTTGDVQPDYPAMVKRRDRIVEQLHGGVGMLLKKNGIEVIRGTAEFEGSHTLRVAGDAGERRVTSGSVIIATGSRCSRPPIPGADLEGVLDSDQLLKLGRVPGRLAIIGAGPVGLEWGDIFGELGSRITVLEMADRVLPPADREMSAELGKCLQKKGFDILTGVAVEAIERVGADLVIRYRRGGEAPATVNADVVLIAAGRKPVSDGLGLERIGVRLERGLIPVNDQMKTSVAGLYAVGDVTPGLPLAHTASAGGEVAAETIGGRDRHLDQASIPSCVYTSPEVAWVGLTEEQARVDHEDVRVGRFPFRNLGRAQASGHRDGLVKVVADGRYGEILGVHMIGAHVTDLISEAVLAISMEATVEEIFHAVHAHPTLPEALHEATLDAWNRAIHKG